MGKHDILWGSIPRLSNQIEERSDNLWIIELTERRQEFEKHQPLMNCQNSHLPWKNTIGLLTPCGLFPHFSIIEANVGVSSLDLTLTEIEKTKTTTCFGEVCIEES